MSNIVQAVKQAKFFAIMVDETTDTASHEQVSLVVRYAAANLTQEIIQLLDSRGLKIENIVGQAYDGAANMSGVYSGVQARIKELNPRALFVHCYAHALNSVIVNACSKNRIARNFFGVVESLYVFIQASSNRHAVFEQHQKQLNPNQPLTTLKSLSDTRWACRADSVRVVQQTLPSIIAALEEIGDSSSDRRAVAEANGLIKSIDFEFLMSLQVLTDLLALTKVLSEYLQKPDIDILCAMEIVSSVKSILQSRRNEEKFSKIWAASQEQAQKLNIELAPSRRRSVRVSQCIDSNPSTQVQFQSLQEEYRIDFFYGVLDLMLSSMDARFNQQANGVLHGFGYLHPKKMKDPAATEAVHEIALKYTDCIDPTMCTHELEILRQASFAIGVIALNSSSINQSFYLVKKCLD